MRMSNSFTSVKSEVVRPICEQILLDVESIRSALREQEIERLMNKRFFRCKTRKEAEEIVDKPNPLGSPWKEKGWGIVMDAKNLIALCNQSSDGIVYIGKDDASLLEKYGNK